MKILGIILSKVLRAVPFKLSLGHYLFYSQFKSFSPQNTNTSLEIAQKKSINPAQNKEFFLKYLYFLFYLIKVPLL